MHTTTWHNPTKDPVRFRIHREPGRRAFEPVEIPPGGRKSLPGEYDQAVQTTHHGIVVGGLAPQLVKGDQEPVPVHRSILDAARLGEKERELMGGRAGEAISLDRVAELQQRLDMLETQTKQAAAMELKLEAERAARAQAEAELTQLRKMVETQTAPAQPGAPPPAPAPKK